MLTYSEAEIRAMNKTARRWGHMPLCYRRFLDFYKESEGVKVLDFGSGPDALWTQELRKMKYDITAHEIGANIRDIHDINALSRKYDVVIASNVLNVQPTEHKVNEILSLWRDLSLAVFFNYPISPRKSELLTVEVKEIAKGLFSEVVEDKLVFVCRR